MSAKKKDTEDGPTDRLVWRILEFAIAVTVSCYLLRLAVHYLMEIWPVLLIVSGVVISAVIAWNVWKHHRDTKW